jgi:riboflavin kinase/FMN adenylyltransferase
MQIHYDFTDTDHIRNAVVTTGSFDGVHIGHRVIIEHISNLAKEINGVSVLITFWPHPRKVLYPETTGKELQLINTQREKIDLLSSTKLDHLIIVPFTIEFAKTSSYDFVVNILLNKIHASIIVVGFNHHFGHNREGSYELLHDLSHKMNFAVHEIPEQAIQNETVSSTKIRQALMNGNLQKANAYLDSIYTVTGPIIHCNELPFSTSSHCKIGIEEEEKLVPPEGYYAGYVQFNHEKVKVLIIVTRNPNSERNMHDKAVYIIQSKDTQSLTIAQNDIAEASFHKRLSAEFPEFPNDIDEQSIDSYLHDIDELIY